MMNVNDAKCKHYYDNKYGTGQSVWDAVMHTTNLLVAGKTVVVAGYGYCGRGVAMRAKGMGANVIVTEIDPIKALEASMDGCRVMPMDEAAPQGDLFVTTTGCRDVLTRRHFEVMKNNAFLSNAGHFNVEVDCEALADMAVRVYPRRQDITGYERTLNLLAEGRLVNLASGNGHPAEIMDTSFSVQALALEYLLHHASELGKQVYDIPEEIDREVSRLKLHGAGLHIDALTPEQEAFARKRLIAALDHYGWRLGSRRPISAAGRSEPMELYFKQRLLSFFDSFDIYDEDDNVVYTVEGQPAWLHKLHVLNAAGEHIATVRQELSLLASFELLVGEESIGCVEQNFSLLRSSFTLDCYDWDIEGDVFGLDYSITASDGRSVAAFSKELFHWTDTYHLSVPREEDVLPALLIVLAIDAARCRRGG